MDPPEPTEQPPRRTVWGAEARADRVGRWGPGCRRWAVGRAAPHPLGDSGTRLPPGDSRGHATCPQSPHRPPCRAPSPEGPPAAARVRKQNRRCGAGEARPPTWLPRAAGGRRREEGVPYWREGDRGPGACGGKCFPEHKWQPQAASSSGIQRRKHEEEADEEEADGEFPRRLQRRSSEHPVSWGLPGSTFPANPQIVRFRAGLSLPRTLPPLPGPGALYGLLGMGR